MKKILLSLGFLAVVFALSFKTTTEVSAETNNDFLYDDLSEGETVVDYYTEIVPDEELIDDAVPFYDLWGKESKLVDNSDQGSVITPSARSKKWYAVSKSYIGHTYSGWKYAGASTLSGGVLTASHTDSVSNTFSGSLTVSKKALSSLVGFNVSKSWSRTVSYSTHSYPSGRYRLEYRHVYKTYKVKQQQKYDPRGKVYATKYVYPKKWVERQYRVVRF